jgi:glycosyltransferase involved in cell wall biosynthesis
VARKLRIVHVMSYFQPKLGYQEYYLAREQQRMGHDVCVITSDRFFPSQSFSKTFGDVLKSRTVGYGDSVEYGVRVVRLPCFFEFRDQIFVRGLRTALIAFNPNVIYVHDEISQFALVSFIHKVFFKVPVVMDVHADYVNMSKAFLRRFVFHVLSKNPVYRALFKKSDAFVAISADSKRWLSNEFGVDENEITVVPLGANVELFSPNEVQRQLMRKKYQLGDSVVFVYAGKLIPGKDVELLLEAAARLVQKGLDVKVLVVGGGPESYQSMLRDFVEKLRIRDVVVFVSYVDKKDLPSYYNAADVGVWPGDPSITILEAMAVGLPVVLSVLENTSHYFKYDIGYRFSRGNVAELTKHLETLVRNGKERKAKGLLARQMVLDFLNWQAISREMTNISVGLLVGNDEP